MDAKNSKALNSKYWSNLRNILERPGPFCKMDFNASTDNLGFLQTISQILVIGAGGLGCELLKSLAFMGFGNIHIIDMDTIELSNLNRQFLFRRCDIGLSKAQCAARMINKRIPSCCVTPHFAKIEDYDESFYEQFHIIVCGLDSIVARRWINGMLISMLRFNTDGTLEPSSVIPMIDGGTEGFKGNARVILPGYTACIECSLDLFPPQVTYPLCTIANTPRLPEHCIEYVKLIQWDKENPFNTILDGDEPKHILWVFEQALKRANQFNISGVTYRLVQGVIKNIIPAVASTNAVIAAACASEVFKLATNCYESMNNYMNFNDLDGIYTYKYQAERSESCLACSNEPQLVEIENPVTTTLEDLIKILRENPRFQMKNPGLTTFMDGKNKTLYIGNIKSIEERTRSNLTMSLTELRLIEGQKLLVADATSPNTIILQLKYTDKPIEVKEN